MSKLARVSLADRQVGMPGHHGDQGPGHLVGQSHDRQRHQPQHRAAVGDQQQQRHHHHGCQQQGQVGSVEGLVDVGGESGPTGDLHRQAGGCLGAHLGADLGDLTGQPGAVRVRRGIVGQRHDQQRRAAVRADLHGRHLAADGEAGQLLPGRADRGPVGGGQLVIATAVDDQGRSGLGRGQPLLQAGGDRRLAAAGQPGRGIVTGSRRPGAQDEQDGAEENEKGQKPRRPAAGQDLQRHATSVLPAKHAQSWRENCASCQVSRMVAAGEACSPRPAWRNW